MMLASSCTTELHHAAVRRSPAQAVDAGNTRGTRNGPACTRRRRGLDRRWPARPGGAGCGFRHRAPKATVAPDRACSWACAGSDRCWAAGCCSACRTPAVLPTGAAVAGAPSHCSTCIMSLRPDVRRREGTTDARDAPAVPARHHVRSGSGHEARGFMTRPPAWCCSCILPAASAGGEKAADNITDDWRSLLVSCFERVRRRSAELVEASEPAARHLRGCGRPRRCRHCGSCRGRMSTGYRATAPRTRESGSSRGVHDGRDPPLEYAPVEVGDLRRLTWLTLNTEASQVSRVGGLARLRQIFSRPRAYGARAPSIQLRRVTSGALKSSTVPRHEHG